MNQYLKNELSLSACGRRLSQNLPQTSLFSPRSFLPQNKQMSGGDAFRNFLVNFDRDFPSDDDEDGVFQPDDASDDDDDAIVEETQDTGLSQCAIDLTRNFKRFEDKTRLPVHQVFLTPCPSREELKGSAFSVPQFDLLRHQSRLHFALLLRSINQTFASSVEMSKNLNELFGEPGLFVPSLGDPERSLIPRSKEIIDQFLAGATLDEVLELPIFAEVQDVFAFNGEHRPLNFRTHSPWSQEESTLLELASHRFKSLEDIRKYSMPARSVKLLETYFKDDWNDYHRREPAPKGEVDFDEVEKQAAIINQKADEQRFELKDTMKFSNVQELPRDLGKK